MSVPAAGAHDEALSQPGVALQRRADELAGLLRATDAPVQRNVFLSLVAGFLADGDLQRFRRLLEILGDEKGASGAHFQRSGSWGDQLRHARATLARLLKATNEDSRRLQSLLGWTARILEIRARLPADASSGPSGGAGPRGRRRVPAGEKARGEPKPHPTGRLGLGGKSLAALERLRQSIDNGDDGEGHR